MIDELGRHGYRLSPGTLYPMLHPIERKGYLVSRVQPGGSHRQEAVSRHRPWQERAPPEYLAVYYWWAYMHPWAVKLFERQWLVNLILWGQYDRLRDAALAEFGDAIGGTTLQVACAYGDLTNRLCSAVTAGGGEIDIVDVLPIQLGNLKSKLPAIAPVRLLAMDFEQPTAA